MVGLSVILETKQGDFRQKTPQVLSKAAVAVNRNAHNSFHHQTPSFPTLHSCFLCNQNLLPGKDIYMYKGDRGFCSVECRCRQIFMDEQDSITKETSSFSSSESGSSSSMAASRTCKSTRNRRKREFAY